MKTPQLIPFFLPFIAFSPPLHDEIPPLMSTPLPRIALHLEDGKRRILDPADIYRLEDDGDDTWERLRSSQRLRDRRTLGVLADRLALWHFVRNRLV